MNIMSIEINRDKCIGCKKCAEVCPGSLISISTNKAKIKSVERCWGCASCLKECPVCAISFFLGEDMGGLGGKMSVYKPNKNDTALHWFISLPDKTSRKIITDSKNANKY